MLAVEVFERAPRNKGFIGKGVESFKQRVLGKPPKQPEIEYRPIPNPEAIGALIFRDGSEHIYRYISGAMWEPSAPHPRIEDGLSLQIQLAYQDYVSLQADDQTEPALSVMSDMLAMASIRYAYWDFNATHLLDRDFPTPEKIAEQVTKIHEGDAQLNRGKRTVLSNKSLADVTFFRRFFHEGGDSDTLLVADIIFTPTEATS